MGRIYLETSAIRALTDYKCEGDVFTSVFVLFELISGITGEDEFLKRKACVKKIFEQKVSIEQQMVDQLLSDFFDNKGYNPDFHKILFETARNLIETKNFKRFEKYQVPLIYDKPFYHRKNLNVLSWLQDWDNRISTLRDNCKTLFNEDKNYIKSIYNNTGMKGLAKHFWEKYEYHKIDENRLEHSSAFCKKNEINGVREHIEKIFSQYNFRLFMTAQAIVFAKAIFIDGGSQDRNNPSDLLHLLYLKEGDKMVSGDKIYDKISEGIEEFCLIKLSEEKCLSELIREKNK